MDDRDDIAITKTDSQTKHAKNSSDVVTWPVVAFVFVICATVVSVVALCIGSF
jgi:hypothetical protein